MKTQQPKEVDKPPESEVIQNQYVLGFFKRVVSHPRTALTILGIMFVASVVIQFDYSRLKNEPSTAKQAETKLTGVSNALQNNFLVKGKGGGRDGILIWCGSCNLNGHPHFREAIDSVTSALKTVKNKEPACKRMSWQSLKKGDRSSTAAHTFLTEDNSASVILVSRNEMLEAYQASECITAIERSIKPLYDKFDGLTVSFSTPSAVAMLTVDFEIRSVMHHMLISAPLFSLLFWLYVGSFWKALTPLVTLFCSVVESRAIIVLVRRAWSGFNICQPDTVVLFVQLALALDYAVIFWGRFRQERARRALPEEFVDCVMTTLKSAGLIIGVSVAVLEVGFAGQAFYPNNNGAGALAIILEFMFSIVLIAIHSVILPAALAASCPSFFDEKETVKADVEGEHTFSSRLKALVPQDAALRFFKWFSKKATSWPWVVVLPVVAYSCMIPCLWQLSVYRPNYDIIETSVSPNIPQYKSYRVYKERFVNNRASMVPMLLRTKQLGPSRPVLISPEDQALALESTVAKLPRKTFASPSRTARHVDMSLLQQDPPEVLLDWEQASMPPRSLRRAGGGLSLLAGTEQPSAARKAETPEQVYRRSYSTVTLSSQFRNVSCRMAEAIVKLTRDTIHPIRPTDIEGVWWNPETGNCSSHPMILSAPISQDGSEQLLMLYPQMKSLMGDEAQAMTRFFWDVIEPASKQTFEANGQVYQFDAQHWSMLAEIMLGETTRAACAPWVIIGTILGICAVVGLFFRSAGVSVKVLISVVVPILSCYGLLVAVWQNGWLQWAGIFPSAGVLSGTMYTTFGFLLGLSIDYDVVLFARVYERRLEGYDNTTAVRMGIVETGPMITLAGTLMTLSFFVMCFDSLVSVRQLATLYFFGVAIDTYIVRTCIAPTVLCLAGRLNYWPGKVPPERKDLKAPY